jgi:peptidylamidoglycolate lyase
MNLTNRSKPAGRGAAMQKPRTGMTLSKESAAWFPLEPLPQQVGFGAVACSVLRPIRDARAHGQRLPYLRVGCRLGPPAGRNEIRLGCGIIVDARDRVYVTSRSTNPCVAIFDTERKAAGNLEQRFCRESRLFDSPGGKDTAHGIYWSKENGVEYLYWTENISTNKTGPKLGARVYKTDLQGKILYQIGNVDNRRQRVAEIRLGKSDRRRRRAQWRYLRGGWLRQPARHAVRQEFQALAHHRRTHGTEDGKFKTCHGIWINTLKGGEPEVYIADRQNGRLQVFDLELNHKRNLTGIVRNPCCFYQHKGFLYIPDLASRVTILDADDNLAAQLGDGKETDGKTNRPTIKLTPHSLPHPMLLRLIPREILRPGMDSTGARPRKFKHVPPDRSAMMAGLSRLIDWSAIHLCRRAHAPAGWKRPAPG